MSDPHPRHPPQAPSVFSPRTVPCLSFPTLVVTSGLSQPPRSSVPPGCRAQRCPRSPGWGARCHPRVFGASHTPSRQHSQGERRQKGVNREAQQLLPAGAGVSPGRSTQCRRWVLAAPQLRRAPRHPKTHARPTPVSSEGPFPVPPPGAPRCTPLAGGTQGWGVPPPAPLLPPT